MSTRSSWWRAGALVVASLLAAMGLAQAQLDENCTATILNRSVIIQPNGTFSIPNVPAEPGYFRVRVTCIRDGVTTVGQSDYIALNRSGVTAVGPITMGVQDPMPVLLEITGPQSPLTAKEETVQLHAIATFADGSTEEVSLPSQGSFWSTSNPNIAAVSPEGLVTARARGQAIIQVNNEGVLASYAVDVLIPDDADNDGMTDQFERVYGFNPLDPNDANQDADAEGLTNLREFQLGTNPRSADTDGDGLSDVIEISNGSNPLRADSDGDGLNDTQEAALGTNPNQPDTDGDGIPESLELRLGLSPTTPDATTTLRGRVVDSGGAAVAGASAIVFDVLATLTGSDGNFVISGVPAGQGNLTVLAQLIRGNQVLEGRAADLVPVAGGVTDAGTLTILLNAGVVAGLVSDSLGRPVVDAQVNVTAGADTRSARTDGTGRYRVENMTAGPLVVTARDYRTGLRGRATGVLPLNASATVDVVLGAFGTVRGTVFGRDGTTPVGAGVTVRLSGSSSQTVNTDALGGYVFEFVPLGQFTVEAQDGAGNRGRNSGNIATTSRTVVSDISFLGRGTVRGLVFTGAGSPATGVDVSLRSESVFDGTANQSTGAGNAFEFPNVFVGAFNVTGVAAGSRLAGSASGLIEGDGDIVSVNITLTAAGTFEGTVFHADGVTPAPAVAVALAPSGLRATTDDQGRYRFDFVPLGSYTFDATQAATGDRGQTTGSLVAQDQVQTVNVTLRGFGTIQVVVRDGAGALVPGAQVSVNSTSGFPFSRSGTTASDGSVMFDPFLAGPFSVQAINPATGLGGSTTGSVAAGGSTTVNISLQGAGGLAGRVLAPDAATPVAGMQVRASGPTFRTATSGPGGEFVFGSLALGTYSLQAVDGLGRQRALITGLLLSSQGQTINQDLIISGSMDPSGNVVYGGTVNGMVTFGDGSPAANVPVSLSGPGVGSFYTRTDVNGLYAISQVPPGSFTVSVSTRIGNNAVSGSSPGSLANHGLSTTVNVVLNSVFDPPSTVRYDANNLEYDVGGDGSLQTGTQDIFAGPAPNQAAALLELVVDGTTHAFRGDNFGTFEEANREIVITQADVGGLNVTRKIYVPIDGYFARYLDVISNPSGSPMTFDVRLLSYYRFFTRVEGGFTFQREPRIVDTSSGDTTFGLAPDRDRWVVIDDDRDGDPFLTATLPPTAHVFDGEGAPSQASLVDYSIDFTTRYGRETETWGGITVGPGETIALMHFVAQQIGRTSAGAAAERLAQLPPEALVGLTSAELGQIVNFDVPLDGSSPVAPLPPLVGRVEGTVFAHDGMTVVPSTQVRFMSSHPLFGRTWSFNTDGSGRFTLQGVLSSSGNSVPVPLDAYVLGATHQPTSFDAPATPGAFEFGLLLDTQNILFSNAGLVAGDARLASGEVVTTGTVTLSGGGLPSPINTAPAGDGTFLFRVVPPGTSTATAILPIPSGTDLAASAGVTVNPGETEIVNLVFPATGEVGGLVRTGGGNPAVDVQVELIATGFLRTTRTGTGGQYAFTDVPAGDYDVSAIEPRTGLRSTEMVTIVADGSTVQDLDLIGVGSLEVQANYTSGPPVAGAQVTLREAARGSDFRYVGTTAANGHLGLPNIAVGDFTVRVRHPGNPTLFGETTGALPDHGDMIDVAVTVPVDAPPTVQLTSPGANTTFLEGTTITLSATASDDLGVQRVEFRVDGNFVGSDSAAPFSILYQVPQVTEDTPLLIVARAVDTGANQTDSAPIQITARDDATPPTVNLISPINGATFLEGDQILIQATATDNTSVARVEFSADGMVLGNDTFSPYNWSYRVPDDFAAAGSRDLVLEARAFDPSGRNTAAQVTVHINPYDQPSISIDDVMIAEGNIGVKNAVFTVSLSAAGTRTVTVNYATADNAASSPADYAARSGSLTFNPGELTKTIMVPIVGETTVEPNETFFVNLSGQTNADLADGQGVGTITDDDGIPGQLHHFAVSPVPSPRFVGEPFDVTVTAQDSDDNAVTDYAGEPSLRGFDGASATQGTVLGSPSHVYSYSAGITVGYAFTPSADITVTHVRHYFGNRVSIWRDDGTLVTSQSVASVPGTWVETALPTPVTLSAGQRYRIGAYSGGGSVFYRFDGPGSFTHGAINQSHYRYEDAFPNSSDGARWYLVDLRYTVGGYVPLTPTTLTGFVNGVWTGQVTAQAPADALRLVVDDADGHLGESNPFAAELRNDVSVSVADSPDPVEFGENITYTVSVFNSGPGAAEGVVATQQLSSDTTFVSAISGQGSCQHSAGTVTCDLGSIPAATTVTVTVVVRPVGACVVTTTVNVTQTSEDTFPANNTAVETTGVNSPEAAVFRIASLRATGAVAVEHGAVTGDDRGGIAIGRANILYTGDSRTASFPTDDLAPGTGLGVLREGLISDLRTGTIYQLGNGNTPLGYNGGTVTSLLPIDETTGALRGPVSREIWTGISGTAIADIPLGNPPNQRDELIDLESPSGFGDLYGVRLRTILTAPATGPYTFWVAGDDNCELWLSTDENPANKTRIATVPVWTNFREWTKYSDQRSAPIELTAGQRYFVEALVKEHSGGDSLSVGWARPGEGTSVPSEIVPSSVLSPFQVGDEPPPAPVRLSTSISVGSGSGLFAGYGRVVLHNGSRVYQVAVPSGLVTDLGAMGHPTHQTTESWAYWGVAEHGPEGVALVYVQDNRTIARAQVPGGALSVVGSFSSLSDMASITVAPCLNRWYFKHEGTSQFRSGDETIGFADASFIVEPEGEVNDLSVAAADSPDPAVVDATLTYTVEVANSGPGTASGVSAVTTLPAGVTFGSAVSTQGTCVESGGVVTCTIGDLPGGAAATITIQVVSTVAGSLLWQTTATRGEADFYLPNNTVVSSTTVVLPTLVISDVTVAEGNAGQTDAVFTVGLSAAVNRTVKVAYFTSNSSAVAGSDYESRTGVLTFDPGVLSQSITVPVFGDLLYELNDVFFVNLHSPEGAVIGDSAGQGTITNDDAQPTLSVADASITEPNVGVGQITFTVSLSAPSGLQTSVNYSTANGSAVAPDDYYPANGTLYINAGQTAGTISVPVVGDVVPEADEDFTVTLSGASQATIVDGMAVGTLMDNDSAAGQIHHFSLSAVASPQFAGEPFVATVTALDAFGNVVTDYAGTPALGAADEGTGEAGTILGPVSHSNSGSGGYTLGYAFTPSENMVVTHFRHYFGTSVTLWTDAGELVHSQSVISSPGTWVETPLTTPVELQAGQRYRLAAYTGGGPYYYSFGLPGTFPLGTIDVSYERSGDVFPTVTDSARWWFVDLLYSVGRPLPVSPTTLAGFVNGIWSGPVAIGETAMEARLLVDDADGHVGESVGFEVQIRNDLAITMTADPETPQVGQDLTYNITVANQGPDTSTGIVVTDQLPPYVYFQSATTMQGTCTYDHGQVVCELDDLADGETATIAIVVRVAGDGALMNTASVTRTEPEFYLPNNTVTVTSAVPGLDSFRIDSLDTSNVIATEHEPLTGDDRGGLALSAANLFCTGDGSTALFPLASFPANGVNLGTRYDGLVSDLKGRTAYVLGQGGSPLDYGGGTVTQLLELDGDTGGLSGNAVVLSQPIPLSYGSGLFSGYGRVVLWDGFTAYQVTLPDGTVTVLGGVSFGYQGSESWAIWGVAEHSGDDVWLVFVADNQTIARTRMADGETTVVASFSSLSDMASIIVAPWLNRWFFHHEGTSQFFSSDEVIGSADANITIGSIGLTDDIYVTLQTDPTSPDLGGTLTYTVTVVNTGPSTATAVMLENTLPTGVSFVSASSTVGTCTQDSGIVSCDVGDLLGGESAIVTIEVTVDIDSGQLENTAVVSRGEPDFYLPNNSVTRFTTLTPPQVWIDDPFVIEGNEGTTDVFFSVNLSRPSSQNVELDYFTQDFSASDGLDYYGGGGHLTFFPGETTILVGITIQGDLDPEGDEFFALQLYNVIGAILADSEGVCAIGDDDGGGEGGGLLGARAELGIAVESILQVAGARVGVGLNGPAPGAGGSDLTPPEAEPARAIRVSFNTMPGRTYRLDYSDRVEGENWQVLGRLPGNGERLSLVDSDGLRAQRFYRLVIE